MTDQNQEYVEIHDEEIVESHEGEAELHERSEPKGGGGNAMTLPSGGTESAGVGGDASPEQVASAGKVTKKAADPKAKGVASKTGAKAKMKEAIDKMEVTQLQSLYASVMEEELELEEEAVAEDTSASDELSVLISEDESLSEDFKSKASIIFEAAINNRVASKIQELDEAYDVRIDSLEEQFAEETEEAIVEAKTNMVDKIDSYLNYVVENWMEENRIAIEHGIRTEIAEDFMGKLHGLFTESYIEVPETKVDLVDQLAEEVQELENRLNAETATSMEMFEANNELKRMMIISEASKDLADTQAAKLEKLAEGVDFENVEKFAFKVETIKESYFSTKGAVEAPVVEETLTEETDEDFDQVTVSPNMAQYIAALKNN